MMQLKNFTKFPPIYKDREQTIKDVTFTSINHEIEGKDIHIFAKTNKYQQEILIEDENIHLSSPVKVFCSCESFKFEFANVIFKNGGLLNKLDFIRSIISRPKIKNIYNVPSGCKHLVALSRQILKYKIKKST